MEKCLLIPPKDINGDAVNIYNVDSVAFNQHQIVFYKMDGEKKFPITYWTVNEGISGADAIIALVSNDIKDAVALYGHTPPTRNGIKVLTPKK